MKPSAREDVFDEPWMQAPARAPGAPPPLPDEHARPDDYTGAGLEETELESVLHSINSEPQYADIAGDATRTEPARLINDRRAGMSPFALAGVVLLVALLAGPVSIVGTLAAGKQGFFGISYLLAGGPVVEEMMKLGGLLFLLEKKPWYVIHGWHIVAAACLSAVLFGIVENVVYGNLYLLKLAPESRAEIMQFRWTVTVLLHTGTTFVGAMGLRKAWLATVAKGRLFDSQIAEPYIAAAVIIHGVYNGFCLLFERQML
jgi:hypothetical protein